MSVDVSKILPGDDLVLKVKVRELSRLASVGQAEIWCDGVGPGANYLRVDPDRIVEHIPAPPKPPQVGDRVRLKQGATRVGRLLSINGPFAWVEWDGNITPLTMSYSGLERA